MEDSEELERKRREEEDRLHDRYGVPRELMERFLRTYTPPKENEMHECPHCGEPTPQVYLTKNVHSLQRYRGLGRIETQLLKLTYSCTECNTENTFTGVITLNDRRNHGLITLLFDDPDSQPSQKLPKGEYS